MNHVRPCAAMAIGFDCLEPQNQPFTFRKDLGTIIQLKRGQKSIGCLEFQDYFFWPTQNRATVQTFNHGTFAQKNKKQPPPKKKKKEQPRQNSPLFRPKIFSPISKTKVVSLKTASIPQDFSPRSPALRHLPRKLPEGIRRCKSGVSARTGRTRPAKSWRFQGFCPKLGGG